jgi:hypothetical protein
VSPGAILDTWERHRSAALRCAIVAMAISAVWALTSGFDRLLFDASEGGAIDLRLRHGEVQLWFERVPVYRHSEMATYPPMSYAVLWPALGWGSETVCRALFAAASTLSLYWLARNAARDSGVDSRAAWIFAALLPLAMNASSVAIGNGQLVLFVVPALWSAVRLAARPERPTLRAELAVVALLLASLVHPTIAIPFLWIVLFVSRRRRTVLLVVLGYAALTLFAAAFQPDDLATLLRDWIANTRISSVGKGYADLHTALAYLGLQEWVLPASAAVLGGLGLWTFCHRRADVWLLLGVTAIVSRLWTYHGLYDDLLILLPMIAVLRSARHARGSPAAASAEILLGCTVLVMLLPARFNLFWSPPWSTLFAASHAAVWLAMLAFLARRARRRSPAADSSIAGLPTTT